MADSAIFDWIERELSPRDCNSEEFFYNEMESQSGYSLPILYQPFDLRQRSHWHDRGEILDYLCSTGGEGQRLLDFGPGDGWPSLLVAPFAGEVVGVDGSPKRVEVCAANADRLGIANARFLYVEPGCPLPFPDNAFDGAMAASSIEQTPDPRWTITELYRVLRAGGRLRMFYESLSIYRNGGELEASLDEIGPQACALTLYERRIERESARMFKVIFGLPIQEAGQALSLSGETLSWQTLSLPALKQMLPRISEARRCSLTHPSGTTFMHWLVETGFSEVSPTHSGGYFAGRLFEQLPEKSRPYSLEGIDRLLRPLVEIVVTLLAPLQNKSGREPMITAVK